MFQRAVEYISRMTLAITIILISSCATYKGYEGPDLPPKKIARIECNNDFLWTNAMGEIVACDNKKINTQSVELLPGFHSLEVTYNASVNPRGASSFFAIRNCVITFNAQAGHKYEINASVVDTTKSWKSWLTDITTGQKVTDCVFE